MRELELFSESLSKYICRIISSKTVSLKIKEKIISNSNWKIRELLLIKIKENLSNG